jgi:hypothetical protein
MSSDKKANKKSTKPKLKELHALVATAKRLALPQVLKVTTDEKGRSVVERPLATGKTMIAGAIGKSPYRALLYLVAAEASGSSGTAYAPVHQANLASTGEWATFAALFDEVRCIKVECGTAARLSTTVVSTAGWGAATFDENDLTALTSIQAALSAAYHVGPVVPTDRAAINAIMPAGYEPHQFMTIVSPRLSRSVFPGETSGTVNPYPIRGDWVSTSASTAIVCFFKNYFEAVASGTWSVRHWMKFDVEFRLRT